MFELIGFIVACLLMLFFTAMLLFLTIYRGEEFSMIKGKGLLVIVVCWCILFVGWGAIKENAPFSITHKEAVNANTGED